MSATEKRTKDQAMAAYLIRIGYPHGRRFSTPNPRQRRHSGERAGKRRISTAREVAAREGRGPSRHLTHFRPVECRGLRRAGTPPQQQERPADEPSQTGRPNNTKERNPMTTAFDLDTIHLDRGGHDGPNAGHCLLEVVSMFAREPFGDSPACVSPYLREFGIRLNDRASDAQRQDLKQFIPLLPGTAGDGLDERRRWYAADHVIRVSTPRWLDAAGLTEHAEALRGLSPIRDRAGWLDAQQTVRAARDAAYLARNEKLGGSLYSVVYDRVKKAVSDALSKQQADAATAAATAATAATAADATAAATAAAADAAVADAAATAATAAATADAAADADAAATAAVPEYGSDAYWAWREQLRRQVYEKVRAVYEERYGDLIAESWRDAVDLYRQLITIGDAR